MLGRVLLGFSLFATFSSRNVPAVVALQVPAGIGLASAIGFQTLLQGGADERYRGRVLGAFGTTVALTVLTGQVLGSTLAGPIGVLPVLYAAAGLFVLAGLLGLGLLPSVRVTERAASDDKAPPAGR